MIISRHLLVAFLSFGGDGGGSFYPVGVALGANDVVETGIALVVSSSIISSSTAISLRVAGKSPTKINAKGNGKYSPLLHCCFAS